MSLPEVRKLLYPFRPVRLHVSDGKSCTIRHPEFFMLFAHKLIVAVPSRQPGVMADDFHIALMHITTIEELRGKEKVAKP